MQKSFNIVCISQVYNELDKDNLKRFFKYLKPLVDNIVVYDDCSTDGSYEYSLKMTPHVIRGDSNDFRNEISHRQQALNLAITLKADIILWLDCDEVLTTNSKALLQKVCRKMYENKIDGYNLHEINLWRSQTWARTDSLFDEGWFTRIWRVKKEMLFEVGTGLHLRAVPTSLKKIVRSSQISVLHYGFSNDYNLAYKYIIYKSHGQRGYVMLDRLINEEKLAVKQINTANFPDGLYRSNEPPLIPRSFVTSLSIVEQYRPRVLRPNYSIMCLIYKDISWLKFVYEQVIKHTDLNHCEFYFVANNATQEVKDYLKSHYIPHFVFEDRKRIKGEWYINNVYRAWNYAAAQARGDFLIFINSDMAFTDSWLDNLIASYRGDNCVTSRLVESGKMPSGMYGISKYFGYNYARYQERKFTRYAQKTSINQVRDGGLFMPLLIHKKHFDRVGGYPEGNIIPESDIFKPTIAKQNEHCVSGDVILMRKLKTIGVQHQTCFSSLVYHFQMGEMSSSVVEHKQVEPVVAVCNDFVTGTMGEKVLWDHLLTMPGTTGIDIKLVGSNNYELKANKYLKNRHKNTEVIIQNASYIKLIDLSRYNIVLLQDNLRRMGRKDLIQEINLKFADKIVTNSIQAIIDYHEYEMHYIPIGVDHQLFKPLNKTKLKTKHELPYKRIGIFVGAFNATKGFAEVKKIVESRSDIFWILVTKNDEIYQVPNARVYSRISQAVLVELFNCADFFLIGSKVETQCLAALEACMCDIPIVMRRIGFLENIADNDLSKLGYVGDDLFEGINSVLKKKLSPREIVLKYHLDILSSLESWRKVIEQGKISYHQNKFSQTWLNQILNLYSYKKYSLLGKNDISLSEVARQIISYSLSPIYYIYRAIKYRK